MAPARKTRALSLCALAIMIGFFAGVNGSLAGSKTPGWILEQQSQTLGSYTVIFNDKGCKMTSKKLGLIVICRAPNWKIIGCSNKKKQYVEMEADAWAELINGNTNSGAGKYGEMKKGDQVKIAGLPAVQYIVSDPLDPGQHGRIKRASGPAGGPYVCEIWVAPGMKLPSRALILLANPRLASSASLGGMLRIYCQDDRGRKFRMLDTTKADRTLVSSAEFDTPRGYSKAKDELSLMMDMENDKDTASLFLDNAHDAGARGAKPVSGRSR